MKIEVIQGTTAEFGLEIMEYGNIYSPKDGDVLKFSVRGAGSRFQMFSKKITEFTDGVAKIQITPDDTSAIIPGVYYYDASLLTSDGFYNIIPYSQFIVRDAVAKRSD